mgnify:CR=1
MLNPLLGMLLHGHRPYAKRVLVKRIDCSLTSGLLMEVILLAYMVFADGALSD